MHICMYLHVIVLICKSESVSNSSDRCHKVLARVASGHQLWFTSRCNCIYTQIIVVIAVYAFAPPSSDNARLMHSFCSLNIYFRFLILSTIHHFIFIHLSISSLFLAVFYRRVFILLSVALSILVISAFLFLRTIRPIAMQHIKIISRLTKYPPQNISIKEVKIYRQNIAITLEQKVKSPCVPCNKSNY